MTSSNKSFCNGFILFLVLIAFLLTGISCSSRPPHPRLVEKKDTVSASFLGPIPIVTWQREKKYVPEDSSISPESDKEQKQKVEDGLINVAFKKSVMYIEKPVPGKLGGKDVLAYPHSYEEYMKYSINKENYPRNLTDQNEKTEAYPAGYSFEYVIDLEQAYQIEKVRLVWGNYGKDPIYITSWKLHTQESIKSPWEPTKEGGYPDDKEKTYLINKQVRRFKIFAESYNEDRTPRDWIGMVEFEAYAKK